LKKITTPPAFADAISEIKDIQSEKLNPEPVID
jgi:hypothetical protein